MKLRSFPLLLGASWVALASGLAAQETAAVLLDTVTLISKGHENIEATGGAVVSQEDIRALQPADVSELFARESAVSVSGGAGPSKRIHIFGMEQSNLAVTVDGVPQGRTGWHHTGSNVIDPAFLKSVEVEAGAAAADAGFAAAAGAVRDETVGAQDLLEDGNTVGGRAGLSFGSNGRGMAATLAGYGAANGFDWFFMVTGTGGKNYKAGDGVAVPGTAPAARGALVKLGYEVETHRFELGFEHSRDSDDRVIKMNRDLNHDPAVYPLKVTRDSLQLKYSTTAPTEVWDPVVRVYASKNGYWRNNYSVGDLLGGTGRVNGDMEMENTTFGGEVKNTFTVGAGTIAAGLDFAWNDYRVDNYGDHSTAQPRIREFSTAQVGLFTQGRFEFGNGISLSTGARYDHNRLKSFDGQSFSGSGASVNGTLAWEITEGLEVFAGASNTWLGYSLGEYGLLHARAPSFGVDPAFRPGKSTNVKAGVNIGRDAWNAGLTFFDTRLKGLPVYQTDPAINRIENGGVGRSRGFTLNGQYRWDTGRAGVSFTKAKVTTDGAFQLADGGGLMPIGEMASIYIDQALPQYNLKVGATLEWAGKLSDPSLTAVGYKDHASYSVVNVYAEWTPPAYRNIAVRLGVDNLFDRDYYERSSYIERDMGSRYVYPLKAPGRTVTLGVNMTF